MLQETLLWPVLVAWGDFQNIWKYRFLFCVPLWTIQKISKEFLLLLLCPVLVHRTCYSFPWQNGLYEIVNNVKYLLMATILECLLTLIFMGLIRPSKLWGRYLSQPNTTSILVGSDIILGSYELVTQFFCGTLIFFQIYKYPKDGEKPIIHVHAGVTEVWRSQCHEKLRVIQVSPTMVP